MVITGMHISVKGEYALLAIFDLAMQSPGVPVRIGEIARRQKIPQKFLELILAGLKQGGFVESRRGAEGGYLLARRPDAITIGEVLRWVDGNLGSKRRSSGRPESPFDGVWELVDSAVSKVIDGTSFTELCRRWRERQSRWAPSWDI